MIGGHNNGDIARVEIFDLEDPSRTCNAISDYPEQKKGMAVGVINGVLKSCGGSPSPHDDCYDYHPETNTWVNSSNMIYMRYYHRASFIESVWIVSGNNLEFNQNTAERWTGSHFESGPHLPRTMSAHCQLTINSTHIFFAEPDGLPNFLMKWPDQTWTELPAMTNNMEFPSCGLINSPTNGTEIVVVEASKVEIFNFESMAWRSGADAPYFKEAGFTQLSDTFVVVGGIGSGNGQYLNSIYKFDNIEYDWDLIGQLQTAAGGYPGVFTLPDSFVTCN